MQKYPFAFTVLFGDHFPVATHVPLARIDADTYSIAD